MKSERFNGQESFRVWRWEVTFPAGEYVSVKDKFGLWLRCYARDLISLGGKTFGAALVLIFVHLWGHAKGFDEFQQRVDAGWYVVNATKLEEFERELEHRKAQHPGAWAPRAWANDAGAEK